MKILMAVILALMLLGCGPSDKTLREGRQRFELEHNMNIIRVSHLDESTNELTILFTYHCPSYYWYSKNDSTLGLVWKIVDICDNVIFISPEFTGFKTFNRLNDQEDYSYVMKEAKEYYERRRTSTQTTETLK